MGCISSKSAVVAPESKVHHNQSDKLFTGARTKDGPSLPPQAVAAAVAVLQPITVESCTATPRELGTAAPAQQQQQEQRKQPDPEFDYDLPPSTAAAIKPAPSGVLQPLGSTAAAGSSTAVQPSGTVGGLLCRQPDWLRNDSSGARTQAAGNMTLFSNSESGATDGTPGSNRTAPSLPPIGVGLGPRDAAGNSSRGHSRLAPLTAGWQPTKLNKSDSQNGRSSAAAAGPAASSGSEGACDTAAVLQEQSLRAGLQLQQASTRSLSNTSSSVSSATSPEPAATSSSIDPANPWSALQTHVGAAGPPSPDTTMSGAAADASTVGPIVGHRVSGIGMASGAVSASVGAGSKHVVREASELVLEDSSDSDAEAGGSICSRTNRSGISGHPGSAVDQQVAAVKAQAVLAEQHSVKGSNRMAVKLQGEGSTSSSYRGLPDHHQQQQQQNYSGALTAERSIVRAGGWGKGSMAAAGTLMLGDDEQLVLSGAGGTCGSNNTVAAEHDDVFGGDSPRLSLGGFPSSRNALQDGMVGEMSSSSAVGHRTAAAAAAVMRQQEDMLGVEEIEDVDALIEAELAAKNALPSDLAAKLAAFEAIADDDE